MGLSDEDVREILRIIDESQLDELRIDMPDFQLYVRRGGAPPATPPPMPPPTPAEVAARPAPEAPAPARPAPPHGARAGGAAPMGARMLGPFSGAGAPGEPPFVDVASRVDADTVVCLIE